MLSLFVIFVSRSRDHRHDHASRYGNDGHSHWFSSVRPLNHPATVISGLAEVLKAENPFGPPCRDGKKIAQPR